MSDIKSKIREIEAEIIAITGIENDDDNGWVEESHHFGQYETAYGVPKERLGYITNYRCKKEGYVIKNWEPFISAVVRNRLIR